MYKIEVNNGAYKCHKDTQAEAETWKAEQISKGRFTQSEVTFEGSDPDYWKECRQKEYAKIDNDRIEAMVEKELGDSTKWNTYVAARNAIKTAHPKP